MAAIFISACNTKDKKVYKWRSYQGIDFKLKLTQCLKNMYPQMQAILTFLCDNYHHSYAEKHLIFMNKIYNFAYKISYIDFFWVITFTIYFHQLFIAYMKIIWKFGGIPTIFIATTSLLKIYTFSANVVFWCSWYIILIFLIYKYRN